MRIFAAAIIALLPLAANADDFARLTAATQLVEYMNARNPFDVELQQQIETTLLQFAKTPCSEKTIPEIGKVLKANITYDKLKPAIIKSYSENYSFQELVDITTFFRSRSGSLWLSKQRQQQETLQQFSKGLMDEQAGTIKGIMDKYIDPANGQCKTEIKQ